MNKRGFTLIEIIICIGIIAFIGTVSFFGIRLVNKNIKENKLERIENKIMLAAETYIETHKDVKTKVNDQGVIIPLNVLHNEGLINLDGIIDKNDDDYVMALLAGGSPGEECESTYIEGSWKIGSKTIYICTKNTGGSGGSNLAIINPESMSNANKSSREPFYFTGGNPYNYVNYGGKAYRILSVDPDDSLVLVGDDLDGVFNNNQIQKTDSGLGTTGSFGCDINTGKVKYSGTRGKIVSGVTFIGAKDLINAKECYVNAFNIESNEVENCTHSGISLNTGWSCSVVGSATSGGTSITYSSWLNLKGSGRSYGDKIRYGNILFKRGSYSYDIDDAFTVTFDNKTLTYSFLDPETIKYSYNKCGFNSDRNGIVDPLSCDHSSLYKPTLYQKVHLKPCMKLNGGVGSYENPYELKSSC